MSASDEPATELDEPVEIEVWIPAWPRLARSLIAELAEHLCPECRQPFIPFPDSPEWLLVPENAEPFSLLYQGAGCIHCGNSGYRGRLAAHEVLPMSPAIRDLVVRRASATELAKTAIAEGMKTIQQDGMKKVIEGRTSLKEMVRVTFSDNNER